MSAAAPNTEFVIYNIPQLAGTALTMSLLKEMLKNPNVVAVKNSSMPTQDIQMFKDAGIAARGEGNFVVFNGPDEQFVSTALQGCQALYVHPQSSNCGNFYSSASLERICLPISISSSSRVRRSARSAA